MSDFSGKILASYTIKDNLAVVKNDPSIMKFDWRFITKQRRGPTGNFHFNFIRVEKNYVYLIPF